MGGRFHKGDLWFEVDTVGTSCPCPPSPGPTPGGRARTTWPASSAGSATRLPPTRSSGSPSTASFAAGPPVDEADLTAEEVADLERRLDRLDGASVAGAWTWPTLALIATQPGVVSTALAETLGRERFALKTDIRKLKAPRPHPQPGGGLRRGRAFLDATS